MPQKEGNLSAILSAVIMILAIFGILYMLSDWMRGLPIVVFCGFLIFVRAFLAKRGW